MTQKHADESVRCALRWMTIYYSIINNLDNIHIQLDIFCLTQIKGVLSFISSNMSIINYIITKRKKSAMKYIGKDYSFNTRYKKDIQLFYGLYKILIIIDFMQPPLG